MRHLLNTYVQADPAEDIGNLSSMTLTELIIETGILPHYCGRSFSSRTDDCPFSEHYGKFIQP